MLIFGEAHLRRILSAYAAYYNQTRTHLALQKDALPLFATRPVALLHDCLSLRQFFIHGSQTAAARSLGLSRWQSLRYVVLPQAVRRVIPPLLNDFIGLQKDSALVAFLGVTEGFQQATIIQQGDFNFTPFVALALVFIVITIPQARFVDRMIARDQRRRQAGATL